MSGPSSLAGRRIVVTRSAEKGSRLTELLAAAAATVQVVAMIETEPLQDGEAVRAALEVVARRSTLTGTRGWVAFTSETAVRLVHDAAPGLLGEPRLAAVGPATARALRSRGLVVDLVPAEATAEALAAALAGQVGTGPVLVLAAEGGRDVVAPVLRRAGVEVEVLVLYRSVIPEGAAARFRAAMSPAPDAVVFTSGSAARHAALALTGSGPPATVAVCIGPTTAAAAREGGWAEVVMASEATAGSLVAAVVERLQRGHPVP